VAVARAIVCQPKVLLLDEPLSALDARLRVGMQDEFRRLHRKLGLTMIYVTHDQQEALSMSDRIAILNAGRIEQVGSPQEIYNKPSTAFAADFVGHANLAEAEVLSVADGAAVLRTKEGIRITAPASRVPAGAAAVIVSLRPEDLTLATEAQTGPNAFAAVVLECAFHGAADRVIAVTEGGTRLVIIAAGPGARRAVPGPGERITCSIRPEDVVILPFQPAGRLRSPLSESQSAIL
jgi:spermidine/putrescine transport system ATP-binding protein